PLWRLATAAPAPAASPFAAEAALAGPVPTDAEPALGRSPAALVSLPEDAAWEGWIGPGVVGVSPRAVEYHGKLYLTTSVAGRARGGLISWDGTHFEATPKVPGGAGAVGVWNDRLVVANPASTYRILALNGSVWDTLGHANSSINAIDAHGTD